MSVRQRAVDLLYAMCDRSNAQQIVAEMLNYLETADYSIREEIVSSLCSSDGCICVWVTSLSQRFQYWPLCCGCSLALQALMILLPTLSWQIVPRTFSLLRTPAWAAGPISCDAQQLSLSSPSLGPTRLPR